MSAVSLRPMLPGATAPTDHLAARIDRLRPAVTLPRQSPSAKSLRLLRNLPGTVRERQDAEPHEQGRPPEIAWTRRMRNLRLIA